MKISSISKSFQEFIKNFSSLFPQKRKLINAFYDTKRFTLDHIPHIIVLLLIIYLITSLSFTSVETFQNKKEKNNEIKLPLVLDKRSNRFTTLITFYENGIKTPINLFINLGTIVFQPILFS